MLEHTTDALIEAYGRTMEEAFENAASGMMDTMVSIDKVQAKKAKSLEVEGKDIQSLLYNWLEAVLVKVTTTGMAFSYFKVNIRREENRFCMWALMKGERLSAIRHGFKTEIKAVTYHLMNVVHESGGVVLRFLLDL